MPYSARKDHSALDRLAFSLALVLLAASTLSSAAYAQVITRYVIPTPDSAPTAITAGPDGALWFTESQGKQIGRISTDGVITEFPLPEGAAEPAGITAGPGGFLWYTSGGTIGRMSTGGEVTTFPLSEFDTFGQIVAGADGNLWTTARPARIARITPAGAATYFGVAGGPADSSPVPLSIAAGADGNVWYTTALGAAVGRITSAGVVRAFPLAPPRTGATAITSGPDGAMWFSAPYGLFRLTVSADDSRTEMHLFQAQPGVNLASGPDGQLWFSGGGHMTVDGTIRTVEIPEGNPGAISLIAGPDGNMWFVDLNANSIGRVTLNGASACASDAHTLCLNHGRFAVIAAWQASPTGPSIQANAVAFSDETGYFWFLEAGNIEVVTKILNACIDPWNAYWFFAAGLTNLGISIHVTDTQSGLSKDYASTLGTPFQPILDTSAFACP
jgi:virginiamycin B lyase